MDSNILQDIAKVHRKQI